MKIDVFYDPSSGKIRPNVTQDAVDRQYGFNTSMNSHGPYHARSGAKSNPHHHSTQARLHHRGKSGLGRIVVTGPEQTGELPTSREFLQEQDLGFS